ncbi:T9SS type A sorting domain-containing protein [Taibaiella koreensis]|uniref:T9SS type A sorting domain-containing protein n=1 Tax=Taibaiella koreensis TaxID=1268548 RepID=UPI0013C3705D|nr:T9SS type A sorting domain-containing protein [Taibaiella koreensis]
MAQGTAFNTLGAMIDDRKAAGSRQHQLPVSGMAAGLYTIRISTDKGFVIRKLEVLP